MKREITKIVETITVCDQCKQQINNGCIDEHDWLFINARTRYADSASELVFTINNAELVEDEICFCSADCVKKWIEGFFDTGAFN